MYHHGPAGLLITSSRIQGVMMSSHRHVDELDSAVRVARRAVVGGRLDDGELSRFLYQRWYLGLSSQQAEVPARPARTWQAWGALWTEQLEYAGSGLVRLHLNCLPPTTLHVLGLVTTRARGWDHPWRLTSRALGTEAADPEGTVLYVPVESVQPLRRRIDELVNDLKPFLALAAPALTLRIGRGAGLAQNPADGRSFGQHRCALVASAVLASARQHHHEQVSQAMHAFADAGVDPQRPYLERCTPTWDRAWRMR
jgi:hypothetical protein